jgi:DNA-binding MarR family transcriptional regulator
MAVQASEISLERNLSYKLSLLTFFMSKASYEIYASRGLTNGQWKVLSVLVAFGPMAAVELGKHLTLDKAAISRAVRQLRELGLTDNRDRVDDGRSVEVLVTAKGRRTYAAMNEEMVELQRRLFDGVSREHEQAFFRVTETLLANLREMTGA